MTTGVSEEELREKLLVLSVVLKNAFTQYERDRQLAGDPLAWVARILEVIGQAHCLQEKRGEHPELERYFEQLEDSLQRAQLRLIGYAEKRGIALPTDIDEL